MFWWRHKHLLCCVQLRHAQDWRVNYATLKTLKMMTSQWKMTSRWRHRWRFYELKTIVDGRGHFELTLKYKSFAEWQLLWKSFFIALKLTFWIHDKFHRFSLKIDKNCLGLFKFIKKFHIQFFSDSQNLL